MASDVINRDPLGTINAVRARQGREPINPFMIEGFGGGAAPPPPMADLPEPLSVEPWTEDAGPAEESGETPPPSPLVPRAFSAPVAPVNPLAAPTLLVMDRGAVYDGTEVALEEKDFNAIATIVVMAAREKLSNRLLQLTGKRVRQRRGAGELASAPVVHAAPAPGEPIKRKRGRPRKIRPDDPAPTEPIPAPGP